MPGQGQGRARKGHAACCGNEKNMHSRVSAKLVKTKHQAPSRDLVRRLSPGCASHRQIDSSCQINAKAQSLRHTRMTLSVMDALLALYYRPSRNLHMTGSPTDAQFMCSRQPKSKQAIVRAVYMALAVCSIAHREWRRHT